MRHVPAWYGNAKFGIMIHWGLYSIPAFAPKGNIRENLEAHDWDYHFRNNPYAEWYLNSLRLRADATVAYHNKRFNPQFRYGRLAGIFNEELPKWDPEEWADLFAESQARYVVLVTKHHDGFLMWPSDHRPISADYVAKRDIVGELGHAVRERGLRYGLYYSGLLDWTVQTQAISDPVELATPDSPPGFAEYVLSHFTELVEKYRPDILWNDIGLVPGINRNSLFSEYRDAVPDGVLNDRWSQISPVLARLVRRPRIRRYVNERLRRGFLAGKTGGRLGDFQTVEYGNPENQGGAVWEAVRGIGNSFGWNQEEADTLASGEELARLLCDVVSRNGNLLLNIGPRPDGSLPRDQKTSLLELSAWLRLNGEAIFGTSPWTTPTGETSEGQPLRFTTRPGALYAMLLDRPRRLSIEILVDPSKIARPTGLSKQDSHLSVSVLGHDYPVPWRKKDKSIEVRFPGGFVPVGPVVIAIEWKSVEEQPPTIEMYTDVIG